jgi:hypothetical protein
MVFFLAPFIGFLVANATLISIGLTIASAIYQRSRQKKLEAEQDKLKGFDLPVEGSPIHLPLVYGRQKVGGVRTMPITRNSIAVPDGSAQGFQTRIYPTSKWEVGTYDPGYVTPAANTSYTVEGGRNDGAVVALSGNVNPPAQAGVRSGSKREFLLMEQALCFGGIWSIDHIEINGQPWDKGDKFDHRIDSSTSGGVANPMSTVNGFPSTNRFSSCAWIVGAFKIDRDSPNYNGIPSVSAYVQGSRVWHVNADQNGQPFLDSKLYSDNSAWVLMDYLLRPESLGGVGLGGLTADQWFADQVPSTQFIDMAAFQRSADIAGTVIETLTTMKGLINGVPPVDHTVQTSVELDGLPDLVNNSTAFVVGEDKVWIYGGETWFPSVSAIREIKLYECHMTLDTERSFRDNIELILETMNEAELIYSNGRYRLVLEYPTSLAEQDAVISKTFTDANIVDDQFTSTYPGTNERYNRAIVKFKDEEKDFSENSVSWPTYYDANNLKMIAEDNGKISETNIFSPGCSNRFAALAKAENIVRASRLYTGDEVAVAGSGASLNQRIISVIFDRSALVLESGDLFKLTSDVFGVTDEVFRVETVSFTPELNVNITAAQFSYTSLAYSDKSLNSVYPGILYGEAVYEVTGLEYNKGVLTGDPTPSNGYLSWSPPANTKVVRYHVETTVADGVWEGELFNNLGTTARDHFPIPVEFSSGEFRYFKVRVEDDAGNISPGVTIYVTDFDQVDINNRTYTVTPIIYGLKVTWDEPNLNLIKEFRVYYNETDTKPSQWLHVAKAPDFTLEPLSADFGWYIWIDAVLWDGFVDVMTLPLYGNPLPAANWADLENEAQEAFDRFSSTFDFAFDQYAEFDIENQVTAFLANATTNGVVDTLNTTLTAEIDVVSAALIQDYYTLVQTDSAISALETTLTADIDGVSATLTQDYYTLAQTDSAIATLETSMNSNIAGVNANLTQNYYTLAQTDIAIAADIATYNTSLNGLRSTISTNTSSINGVTAVHGVEIDNNGHISGFGLISDLVNGSIVSDFLINADNFRVGNSSNSSNYIAPFQIIGSTTYIKKAVIKDGDIETLKIKGNAVTVPMAQTATISRVGNNSLVEVQWLNLTLDYPGHILVQWSGAQGYTGVVNHEIQLRVGGSTVMTRGGDAINDMPNLSWASSAPYSAGTYRVGLWWRGANSGINLSNGTLSIIGAKR